MENIGLIIIDSAPQIVATFISTACIGAVGYAYRKKTNNKGISEKEVDNVVIKPVSSETIAKAEDFIKVVAAGIIKVVRPYQEVDPISIDELYSLWCDEFDDEINEVEFKKVLEIIITQERLPGIVRRGDKIFIEESHFSWKSTFAIDDKDLIAKTAVKYIKSGDVIALDAGSTTLAIAKEIATGIKTNLFTNIVIVTNFFKAVDELLKVAMDLGMTDCDSRLKIYIVGGRVRLNTLAIVDDDSVGADVFNDYNDILSSLGGADIAFVGTSGISRKEGFAVQQKTEVATKKSILNHSKRKIVVADPSKIGLLQGNSFAGFDENIEIITTKHGDRRILREYEDLFTKEGSNTKLTYAK